jgi:predicted transcriptional regulator YheO
MTEDNNMQKIKRWNTMSKRPIGRPKTRWEDDILEDIKSMNLRNWKKVAQNRDSWKKVVEQASFIRRKSNKTILCQFYHFKFW